MRNEELIHSRLQSSLFLFLSKFIHALLFVAGRLYATTYAELKARDFICHLDVASRAQNMIRDFRAILRREGVVKSLWIRRTLYSWAVSDHGELNVIF